MASKTIVKRKASTSPTKITKKPKLFLDEAVKTRFEDNFKDRGICTPRKVNLEFFDKELGLTVFHMFSLMGWRPFLAIKEKKIDLTMRNLRAWIGLKEGDFKRYSTKEPISIEVYSHEKAVKKITGGISGEFILGKLGVNERLMVHVLSQMILPKAGTSNDPSNFDIFLMWCALKGCVAFIILNHMKDTLARPNADLPYGSLITIIARYREVVYVHDDLCEAAAQAIYDSRLILNMSYRKIDGVWVKIGKPKSEPGEGTFKRKMNVKHGRQPPKIAGRRKSSRLLKKESRTPSSPIQVSDEDKVTEEVDSDDIMYSNSPTPPEKTEDTMHSSSSEKKSTQGDQAPVTSQRSATDLASDHDPDLAKQPVKPPSTTSLRSSASSPEPTPAPLTPLAEIRAHLQSLIAQVTTALEEI
ncbi:hypothetical protein G2W53_010804 [Senna tora]|uniref:Uncharacterized protein n=1 Tax=Senna tora TaxID=362788 RepID=A0A834X1K5_9FABA|nr:hypothetical protein G2W53_010804 [Senna tora]